ncbi:hypothetical protein EKO23_04785 [Nocardioides guangzhouensis]|uniref:Uncharacterized protein n=1 Tax=Nocardioides guangzhouensis TaxID=2497878 RepID=A0A4Q4ZHP0_9ACTN|nr:hypothetical protein [Nocardioides guangzhouensis]RYP87713.1 hypothetical protein EKO23_04785 [Nocardioides guangzhouensis]
MSHTTERSPVQAPSYVHVPHQRPPRSVRKLLSWVAIVVALIAATAMLVLTITSDTGSPRIQPEQPTDAGSTADGNTTRPEGVPWSADAAERYFAQHNATRPEGVPWSADAAERYFANHE